MRTFSVYQRDLQEARYTGEKHNPEDRAGANAILSQREGKASAKRAIAELAAQAKLPGQGYLPTARLSAPLHVLVALTTVGVVEKANDDRGKAWRYRLTAQGRKMSGIE